MTNLKKKILSQPLSYWPSMPQWLLLQGYLLGYSHPEGGQWSALSHWMIYSSSRHQTLPLHFCTSGVASLRLFWWMVGFWMQKSGGFVKDFWLFNGRSHFWSSLCSENSEVRVSCNNNKCFRQPQPQNSYPVQDLNIHKLCSWLWNSAQILMANHF